MKEGARADRGNDAIEGPHRTPAGYSAKEFEQQVNEFSSRRP